MRDALKVLLQVRDEGVLAEFAIGGAIAASFYAAAVSTEGLDVFAFLKPSAGKPMSNDSPDSKPDRSARQFVDYADMQAHVAKVKAAWREHQMAMTWEQKIKSIERMRERDAQLRRARELI